MTNHEWIKSLSPEEYAEEFKDYSLCEYLSLRSTWCKQRESCVNCCVEWLQSEHKDGDT